MIGRWLLVHWPVVVAGLVCLTPFVTVVWILIEEAVDAKQHAIEDAIRKELEL